MEEQLTQQPETNQTQQNQEIPNRRERRRRLKQQGVLRYLSKLSFFNPIRANFRAENIKTGKRIQEIRRERIEKAWEEFFEAKIASMKETWYDLGYNAKEIALLEEASIISFVKNKETYREDKKRAQALTREAAESLASRK
jgi:hypothetical protein